MDRENRTEIYYIFALVALFIGMNLFSHFYQVPIAINEGKGFDGVHYYKITEDLKQGLRPEAYAPFVYRMGLPFLIAKFGSHDIFKSFGLINLMANSISLLLIILWVRKFHKIDLVSVLAISIFILHWHSPVRYCYFYPITLDPLSMMITLLGLFQVYLLKEKYSNSKLLVFVLYSILSVSVREVCLLPAIALIFINQPFKKGNRFILAYYVPLLFGAITFLLLKNYGIQTNDYSGFVTALKWIYKKSLIMYLHAWFISFGTIIAVIIYFYKDCLAFFKNRQELLVFFIVSAIFGLIGGTDQARILFWSFPVTILLIIEVINKNKKYMQDKFVLLILLVSQVLSMRVFYPLPEHPNEYGTKIPLYAIQGTDFNFLNLYTIHGDSLTNGISAFQYFLTAIVIFFLLQRKKR